MKLDAVTKSVLRRACSIEKYMTYGRGGLPKEVKKPRPITLPKLRCLQPEAELFGKDWTKY